jgi:C4-dicarboxylate-specific signal transduction histidine kinase
MADIGVGRALVKAHHEQIGRVLMNVLTNAVQALEENEYGVIATTLYETETMYCITVEDNGKGIDEEVEAKLFAPNFTTKKKGSGLGLSICRNILEDYGGTINYCQSSLGGARFIICLPKSNENEG